MLSILEEVANDYHFIKVPWSSHTLLDHLTNVYYLFKQSFVLGNSENKICKDEITQWQENPLKQRKGKANHVPSISSPVRLPVIDLVWDTVALNLPHYTSPVYLFSFSYLCFNLWVQN